MTQVLRRFGLTGELSESRGREAIDDHLTPGIVRYPHEGLLNRVWQLRANCTAYDATCLAVAEAVDAVLITCDRRLAAVPGSGPKLRRSQAHGVCPAKRGGYSTRRRVRIGITMQSTYILMHENDGYDP